MLRMTCHETDLFLMCDLRENKQFLLVPLEFYNKILSSYK